MAERIIRGQGAIPAFKGYRGYQHTICASVNEEVVHGVPSEKKLKDGDIVSIDVGAKLYGYYGIMQSPSLWAMLIPRRKSC